MSFMRQMAKDMRDMTNGKIIWYSCGYRFSSEGWTNPNGVFLKATKDDLGRDISLVKGKHMVCPDVETRGELPLIRGHVWVKGSACLKCQHRLPKGCCALLRERNKGVALKIITEAVSEANKIVGGIK